MKNSKNSQKNSFLKGILT